MSPAETPPAQSSELPKYLAINDDRGAKADLNKGSNPKAPRWPFALIVVAILVIVVLHLTGILGPGLH